MIYVHRADRRHLVVLRREIDDDHQVSEQERCTNEEHDPGAAGHVRGRVMLCSDGCLGTAGQVGPTRLIMPFFLDKGLIMPWSSTIGTVGSTVQASDDDIY